MVLVEREPEEKSPLGRRRCRWENNIKVDVKEIGCEGVDWICLAEGHVADFCQHGNERSRSIKCGDLHD
jgi:hypothetical protein